MNTPGTQRGLAIVWWLVGLLAVAGLLFALYIWGMLSWSYSKGERAGWVQKLSKKGYVCKTWEGEMAMVSLPGSVPEKFIFTIWDDRTAEEINRLMGKRVAVYYEEHIGLPTSCFGETAYFARGVKLVEDTQSPMIIQSVPGTAPSQAGPAQPQKPQQ